ncbi:hypothetical protein BCV69DRAFT_261426 [Microstroma glucosiphilum]|uniref:glutathione transferase n=1 Tax=Pseudomicrostroma glucosiphilum TaxID=1684307 RepID=A0A316U247_9BASI|nr:hypothetical protein BCV69DRAFT_261426 [Pseudomicrostroma glucosiphilum]PWN19347.1 hypothetical protein BCV69DRAFT_261426 [Pseudomicrostroma glucosiphilum]
MAPLIVHHLNNSRSQRILWLLEELNVNYEIKHYKRGPDRRAPKSLRDVHPLGKSPLITTEEGRVIAESGTICEYIIKRYAPSPEAYRSSLKEGWIDDSYWSQFAEASFMPAAVMKLVFTIVPTQSPFLVRPLVSAICNGVITGFVDPELAKLLSFASGELKAKGGQWFAGGDAEGNPTLADFQMLFPVEAAVYGGRMPASFSFEGDGRVVKEWIEKVHARPAYKRALEKGGPYDYA